MPCYPNLFFVDHMHSTKLFAAKYPDEDACRYKHDDSPVDHPLWIARHITTRQDVDAL